MPPNPTKTNLPIHPAKEMVAFYQPLFDAISQEDYLEFTQGLPLNWHRTYQNNDPYFYYYAPTKNK